MNIQLEPAQVYDAEALAHIQKQAFKRLYDLYQDEGSPYLRGAEEIIIWLERPNWYVYKILVDGVLCGGIIVSERQNMPGEMYLARLYVLPEMQSKGIALRAIVLCEAYFPAALHWTVDFPADQKANRRCYEKAGYYDTGRVDDRGQIVLAYYEKELRGNQSLT